MRLRKRTDYIRKTDQKKPFEKINIKVNFSRYIYFIVILIIVFIFIRILFLKSVYITGNGLIRLNPILIRTDEDMIMTKLYIKEGLYIEKGEPLFSRNFIGNDFSYARSKKEYTDSGLKKRRNASAEKDIGLMKIKKKFLIKQRNQHKKNLIRLQKLTVLEAVTQNDLFNEKKLIKEMEFEISALNNEISVMTTYKKQLENSDDFIRRTTETVSKTGTTGTTIYSPIDGQIVRIFIHENELAIKGESVVKLASLENMMIKGYFAQDKLKYLTIGQSVKIEFPDKSVSEGIINKFYFSTLPLPQEFQKKYEPLKRTVIVDILPAVGKEDNWLRFHKLSVKLSICRYKKFNLFDFIENILMRYGS